MQKLAILLRKSAVPNTFREIILACFSNQEFNEILICSGFFQEKVHTKTSFFASQSFIDNAPTEPCKKTVTTIGIYNRIWKEQYDDFASSLSKIACKCGIPITIHKKQIKKYQWHAKVFIASTNGKPVLGIIGSSNMTSRAFGELSSWNYEADVVLWDDTNTSASSIMTNLKNIEAEKSSEMIVGIYDQDDPRNRGLSLSERLITLRQDIEAKAIDA